MRLIPALSSLVLTASIVLAGVAVADAAPNVVNYVALGDSYAAGVGTATFYGNGCDTSSKGYPALWVAAHPGAGFIDAACSGAKTSDVINSQVSSLGAGTTLVSITVGGNDAGFVSVMENCVLGGDSACENAVASASDYSTNTLPGLLDNTYAAVRRAAPNATVYVLGYPRLYQIGGSCSVGLSETSRGYVNGGADTLDSATAAAAGRAGFTFVDVRPNFANHGICSSSSWINSVSLPVVNSYHPNVTGYQRGYLPAFTAVTG